MMPGGYTRVPTAPGRVRAAAGTPLPLALRILLAAAALCGGAYWWPAMNGTYRFLLVVFSVILWAQVSTGAWAQDARVFRRHTDALQKQERQRAWRAFKEAAFGKSAVQINALGGLNECLKRATTAPVPVEKRLRLRTFNRGRARRTTLRPLELP